MATRWWIWCNGVWCSFLWEWRARWVPILMKRSPCWKWVFLSPFQFYWKVTRLRLRWICCSFHFLGRGEKNGTAKPTVIAGKWLGPRTLSLQWPRSSSSACCAAASCVAANLLSTKRGKEKNVLGYSGQLKCSLFISISSWFTETD